MELLEEDYKIFEDVLPAETSGSRVVQTGTKAGGIPSEHGSPLKPEEGVSRSVGDSSYQNRV